ncbi:hypothetical protein H4R34_004706 [Dimargaris verticillata]|uniref:Gfd2/YDR514C-like C-terminal domain-containing protein n=1 Tax=Dimargaris verticillata TaxID=2761393 RepID=A0A9W8E6Y2_9FUNG|nr:hypothetical protein H4R34_004706 [Dimargaris verticillata]
MAAPAEKKLQAQRDKLRQCKNWVNLPYSNTLALDIEAYEHQQDRLTEIGWTVYCDQKCIHSFHYIVLEHQHLHNRRFVAGCKNNYNFGQSIVAPLAEIIQELQTEFTMRPDLALVAHGVHSDLAYLRKVGVAISPSIRTFDTKDLFCAYTNNPQNGRKLAVVLQQLNIPCSYLHNAGNDAYYTLKALLVMCELPGAHNF